MAMIDDVRLALRLTTIVYDSELTGLMSAALADLGVAGVIVPAAPSDPYADPLIHKAVITYCKKEFGSPADYDRLNAAYKEMKAQLATNTGHTDWGDV